MPSLETSYMGMTLKNPIIIGSCGLTNSTRKIKELESNGAAAVVLKSIFEEQILMEANHLEAKHLSHVEEMDYLTHYTQTHTLEKYLKLIKDLKKEVSIPVIASINCSFTSPATWGAFAKKIQNSGANALELNIFILPGDFKQKGEDIEKIYFDVIDEVNTQVSIPIALKLSFYFSGLANMVFNLSVRSVSGIVLFNRFYRPDVDLDSMTVVSSHIFSTPEEIALPLRWIGLLSNNVKCDLAAATGIYDGNDVIKCLLVGAKAVQAVTTIYKNGPTHIDVMLKQIKNWMKQHHYGKLQEFIGKLSHDPIKNPVKYERCQFMKYYSELVDFS